MSSAKSVIGKILKIFFITVGSIILFLILFIWRFAYAQQKTVKFFTEGPGKQTISKKELDEDLKAAEYILENAYVAWELGSKEKGFDFSVIKNDVLKNYEAEKSFTGEYPRNKFETALKNSLVTNLKIPDGHLSVGDATRSLNAYNHYFYYWSDLWFIKRDGEFFLYQNGMNENAAFDKSTQTFAAGTKYTGNSSNLHRDFLFEEDVYRYAVFSNAGNLHNAVISLENENYPVSVNNSLKSSDNSSAYKIFMEETEDSLYIALSTFMFPQNDSRMLFNSLVYSLPGKVENKKSLILDFRGNSGGYTSYASELISSLFCTDENSKNELVAVCNALFSAEKYLDSLLTSSSIYWHQKNGEFNSPYGARDFLRQVYFPKKKLAERKTQYNFSDFNSKLQVEKIKDLKIIIITDSLTSSAAELCTAFFVSAFPEQTVIIGENSNGCSDFGGVWNYWLPNSGIFLFVSYTDNRASKLMTSESVLQKWQGDTKGFKPDFVVHPDSLDAALQYFR